MNIPTMIKGNYTTIIYKVPEFSVLLDEDLEKYNEHIEVVRDMVQRVFLLTEAAMLEPKLAEFFDRILGTTAEMMIEELNDLEKKFKENNDNVDEQ